MNDKAERGTVPPQRQSHQPGTEGKMFPKPESEAQNYLPAGKLKGRVALISGGDSGIGKSVAIHFAKEGAAVAVIYLEESKDAERTKDLVEKEGQRCLLLQGDISNREFCRDAVRETVPKLGRLTILVTNAPEQPTA